MGGGGGAAAGQPQPGADADGLRLGVATAAAVSAAAGTEETRDGRGVDGGEMAELVRYVKWTGKTRGRREKRGTRPFSHLVGRAGRPRERRPEMDEGRWSRMLGEALPGVSLEKSPGEGEEAQSSDAAGAVAAGGAVRGRRIRLGRSTTEKSQGPAARGVREGRAEGMRREMQGGRTRGVGEGGGG